MGDYPPANSSSVKGFDWGTFNIIISGEVISKCRRERRRN